MNDVVLFSGGFDSTYILKKLAPDDALPLFIVYGQRHLRSERRAAAKIAPDLVERTISIPWQEGGLTGPAGSWIVPNRNTILVAIGAAEAQARGAENLWIGCCKDDAEVFADCRPNFIAALADAMLLSCGVTLRAPLLHMTKREMLNSARHDLLPHLVNSWSCYDPKGGQECGECLACEARSRAFRAIR